MVYIVVFDIIIQLSYPILSYPIFYRTFRSGRSVGSRYERWHAFTRASWRFNEQKSDVLVALSVPSVCHWVRRGDTFHWDSHRLRTVLCCDSASQQQQWAPYIESPCDFILAGDIVNRLHGTGVRPCVQIEPGCGLPRECLGGHVLWPPVGKELVLRLHKALEEFN